MTEKSRPPFVDVHSVVIAAPRSRVLAELDRSLRTGLVGIDRPLAARLLGTEPSSGVRSR